jgi:hypothetical protein
MGVHVEVSFAWLLKTHDAETLALNQLDPRLYAMNACANIMLLTSTAVVFRTVLRLWAECGRRQQSTVVRVQGSTLHCLAALRVCWFTAWLS